MQNTYLEFWERKENNEWVVSQTNQVGLPNEQHWLQDYPSLNDLLKIPTSPINDSNEFRVFSLQYQQ